MVCRPSKQSLNFSSESACFACPSAVYCRGHHSPSVRLHASASSHQRPRPLPCLLITLPMTSLAECHITQQLVCVRACVLQVCRAFSIEPQKGIYCSKPLRQRPLIRLFSFFFFFKAKIWTTGWCSCQVLRVSLPVF